MADPKLPPLPPALLVRYEVGEPLGAGAMGVVYRARHKSLDRPVALKVIRAEMLDEDGRKRFDQEAKLAGKLMHANVVAVFDSGTEDGTPFIALELIDGPSLRHEMDSGRMEQSVAVKYIADIAQGLAAAHVLEIIHRDVKPENILITQQGQAKIADFGISRPAQRDDLPNLTATGTILGSPLYMSPEQACNRVLTPATDQYSLGIVLYEVIVGRPPFSGSTAEILAHHLRDEIVLPPDVRSRVHLNVLEVLEKMLRKDPLERYPDCGQVALALNRALARWQGRRSNTRPTPLPQPVPPELALPRGTRASGLRPAAGSPSPSSPEMAALTGASIAPIPSGRSTGGRSAMASQSRVDAALGEPEPLPTPIRYGLAAVAALSAIVIAFWAGKQRAEPRPRPPVVESVADIASAPPETPELPETPVTPERTQRSPSAKPADWPFGAVLGNIRKKVYHIKGRTKPQLPERHNIRLFASEADAQREGYRKVGEAAPSPSPD